MTKVLAIDGDEYEDLREATYDQKARLVDMDTNHVEVAINYPNTFPRFAGQGFGAFKPALAELMVETLRPIGARLAELQRDPAELDRLLGIGAEKARAVAAPTLAAAYQAMGL